MAKRVRVRVKKGSRPKEYPHVGWDDDYLKVPRFA